MKKDIITIILVITFIIAAFGIASYLNFRSEKEELSDKITLFETTNEELNEELRDLKKSMLEENEALLNYDCEYTETYRYISDYHFVGNVPSSEFIIVDKFQEFSPKILEIDTTQININFEKNKNYEFTFESSKINGEEGKVVLIKVIETEKTALEQTQEYCGIRTKVNKIN